MNPTLEAILWRLKREHVIKAHAACEILSLMRPERPCEMAFIKQFYRWTDYKLNRETKVWMAGPTRVNPREEVIEAMAEWLTIPREED